MKKAELIEMLKEIDDNEEIMFIEELIDRDGYPTDFINNKIYNVVGCEHYKEVREKYGIYRIKKI